MMTNSAILENENGLHITGEMRDSLGRLSSELVILRNTFLTLVHGEEWHSDLAKHEKMLAAFGSLLDRFTDKLQEKTAHLGCNQSAVYVEKTIVVNLNDLMLAIPLTDVACIQPLDQTTVSAVGSNMTIQYNNQTIAVLNLSRFGINSYENLNEQKTAVIIRSREKLYAIFVDSIKSQLETVVRPFDLIIGEVYGFKGTTILDNEYIAYVLDPQRLEKIDNLNKDFSHD